MKRKSVSIISYNVRHFVSVFGWIDWAIALPINRTGRSHHYKIFQDETRLKGEREREREKREGGEGGHKV